MTSWHVDEASLRRWMEGTDTSPAAASVEQHLLSCDACRRRVRDSVGHATGGPALPFAWARIRDAVEAPRPTPIERLLTAAGLPATDARLVGAARAFRASWITAALIVLAFVEVGAALGPGAGHWLFLAVAPLLPCVAVAAAYDPELEPALEHDLATPYPAARLVLLRTLAVLALVVPLVLVVDVVAPTRAPYLWLLPAAGFVAAVLALSTFVTPLRGAAVVSAGWLAAVWSAGAGGGTTTTLLRQPYASGYAALAVVSVAVVVGRRRHLRDARTRRS